MKYNVRLAMEDVILAKGEIVFLIIAGYLGLMVLVAVGVFFEILGAFLRDPADFTPTLVCLLVFQTRRLVDWIKRQKIF